MGKVSLGFPHEPFPLQLQPKDLGPKELLELPAEAARKPK
jgi:hypothetical protein